MRIGIFADSYLPYQSGVSISVDILYRNLIDQGHQVHIFCPDYPGATPDQNVTRFASFPTPYRGFRITFPYLPHPQIDKDEFDIIHSQSPFGEGQNALKLAQRKKIPLVYTLHTMFAQYTHYLPFIPQELTQNLLHRWIRRYCDQTAAVIVPSLVADEYLRKGVGFTGKSVVLPTGIQLPPLKTTRRELRQRLNIPESATVVVTSGRLAKEKNFPFLFDAFKIIAQEEKERAANLYLLLIGGGPEEATLRKHAEMLGLTDRVRFTGEVKHAEVFEYLQAGDVFIYASTTETQGLVIAEAKLMGLPVAAVRGGGVVQSIVEGEDGFLTENNPAALANAALQLIQNPSLHNEYAKKARHNAERDLTAKSIVKKTAELYASLIK